jgi:hypothetical protein
VTPEERAARLERLRAWLEKRGGWRGAHEDHMHVAYEHDHGGKVTSTYRPIPSLWPSGATVTTALHFDRRNPEGDVS